MTLLMVPAFAGYHDSYAYLWEDEDYAALIDAVKENLEPEIVDAAYETYIGRDDVPASDKTLVEYHLVRYYVDRGLREKAEEHYYAEEAFYNSAEFGNETERMIAEFDLLSSDYYIWRNALGAGLGSSNLGKKIYKADPDEYRTALNEAFRLLSSPHIAGGSPKKALRLFEEILPDVDGMNKLDRYSLYSGLAMSSYERKEYDDSRRYFDLATEIYPPDPTMQEYIDKLND